MAWIETVDPASASGLLKRLYEDALARAGRVWNILRLMSLRPRQARASMGLYREVMFGVSSLSRAEREMVAVVVSAANRCYY